MSTYIFKECNDYIKKTKKMGYKGALVNVGYGRLVKHPSTYTCTNNYYF